LKTQHTAEIRAQLLHGSGHDSRLLLRFVCLFWILPAVRNFDKTSLVITPEMFLERNFLADPIFAQPHQGFVDHNPGQPSGESSLVMKAPQIQEGFLKTLLNHVPSILTIPRDVECNPEHPRFMPREKKSESLWLSVSRRSNKDRIAFLAKYAARRPTLHFGLLLSCFEFMVAAGSFRTSVTATTPMANAHSIPNCSYSRVAGFVRANQFRLLAWIHASRLWSAPSLSLLRHHAVCSTSASIESPRNSPIRPGSTPKTRLSCTGPALAFVSLRVKSAKH
jgi:hypothetical protein